MFLSLKFHTLFFGGSKGSKDYEQVNVFMKLKINSCINQSNYLLILDLVLVDMRINNLLLIYQTLKVREKYFCLLFVFFPSSSRAFSFLLLFLLFLFFGFSEDYHLSIYYLLSWFQELFFFNIVYSINFLFFGIWNPYFQ